MNSDFHSLLDKLFDDRITEQELQQLQQHLTESADGRREYVRQAALHSSLQVYADIEDSRNAAVSFAIPPRSENTRGHGNSVWWRSTIASCVVLVVLTVVSVGWYWSKNEDPFALTVVSADGVNSMEPIKIGSKCLGPISFSHGLLTLATRGGSLISLEGPCHFEMIDANIGRLSQGKLVAFCGEDAKKLTVDTPDMQYTDLGTEFGVSVVGKSSSLHVFDGLVMVSDMSQEPSKPVLVEAASSLRFDAKEKQTRGGLADLSSFVNLRQSLAAGGIVEDFKENPLESPGFWTVSSSNMEDLSVGIEASRPLVPELNSYLRFEGTGHTSTDTKAYSSAVISWDYGKLSSIDLSKAHTVECLIRLDSDARDIRDLMLFGGDELVWQKRAWELRALPSSEKLMWSIYNPKRIETNQYLETKTGRVYRLLVEIDPEIGRYRKTVSNGENRVWSQLSDGSPAKLKETFKPVGMLHWRIRGLPGKKVAFSVDAVRVRNRPIFGGAVN